MRFSSAVLLATAITVPTTLAAPFPVPHHQLQVRTHTTPSFELSARDYSRLKELFARDDGEHEYVYEILFLQPQTEVQWGF